MKTKISHLGRSTVSVILAVMMLLSTMLIGTVSTVNAIGMSNGACIYFDNSKTNWKDKYINFVIGKDINNDNYSSVYVMSRVGNTDLYYCQMPDWSGATYVAVCGTTAKWDSGTWSSTNLTNATHYTATYTDNFNFESNKSYLLQTSSSTNNTALTPSYFDSSNGSLNVEVKVDNSTPSSSIADISVNSYKFGSSKDSVESTSATISSDSVASTNLETAYSAITTLKCNNIKDGYKFVGWYVDNSLLSSNKSYTYNPYYSISSNKFGSISVEARFEQDMSSVAGSVTLTASPETVTSGGSTKLTATLTDKATGVDKVTYTFKKDDGTVVGTVTDSAENTASVDVANITSDTKYTVTVSADNYTSVTNTVTVTATSDSSDKYAIHVKLADNLESYTLWLWAWEKGGSNAYGDAVTWKSDDVKVSLNDHEWHNYPFKNPVKNWNLIIAYDKGQTAFENGYNSDVWITVNGDGNYDVSTIAPTKYTVTYGVNGGNGTLTATGVSGSGSTVNSGTKVTFTATPNKDYSVEGWYSDAGCTNKIESTGTNKTYTVTVNADTNVYVKFREANKYTVKFNSNDPTFGTVSATNGTTSLNSDTKVTEGDEVTFTAEPKSGYALSSWTVNGAPVSPTTNPYKITVNSNTTVVANFEKVTVTPSGYYLLCGTDATFKAGSYKSVPLYKNGENAYYADFDVAKNSIPKSKDYFIIFSTKEDTSGIIDTNDAKSIIINTDNNGKGFSLKDHSENVNVVGVQNTKNLRFAKVYIDSDDVTGFTININNLDLRSKKITYSAVPTFDVAPADTVEITAKDGTIRGTTATIADLGNTTIEVTTPEGKTLKATDSFSNKAQTVKKVPDKSTVKVTTTIDKSKTFAGVSGSGYYVKGFSINGIFGGVLSQSEGKSHDSDVYTFEFTVNQELYNETKLEITPVYFLKDDSNCVYFYIENYDSAKQIWGNTPSCYVYYDSGKTTLEALGYYPGQPMVDYNGSIFTQIPKSIDNGGTTPVKITGMTLNNYVWDDVHSAYNGKNQREDNAQTYDYDDFVKIAESGAADNIIYRFKYNTFDNEPADTFDASKYDATGWEVFLDYQNYPTDIFGNRIGDEKLDYKDTNSVTSKANCLSIISDGYQTNYIGQYATAWSIYKKTGEKVATIPSSALLYALGKTEKQMTDAIELGTTPGDFLPGKTDRDTYWKTFKTLYENYKGFYAQINFEAAIKQGPDVGNRLDGRWYYTKSEQEITGEIKIQYANTLNDYNVGDFYEDTFADDQASSVVGKTTGASAYFTDPKNKVRKLNTTADNTQDYKFEVTATPSTAAYTFVGWYRLIDGDYKAINPSDMSSLKGAVTRNSDVTLVARYIKTPGGSMTFHHSLYNGTNAGGGKATTEIQVVVTDSTGESLYNSERIAGTASIDKAKIAELAKKEGLTVTVTLYTTTKNLYDFKGYYSAENTTDITDFNPTAGFKRYDVTGTRKEGLETKSEYTFSFDEYYNKHKSTLIGDNAGTVYYNFYSDITSIKVPYKVQFSYKDREGNQKYYNRAGYVDPENTSSYTIVEDGKNVKVTLENSFILTLAPYESNFAKDLTWKETPDINNPFNSSVPNSIASAVLNSTQSDKKIYLNVFRDKKTNEPTSRDNKNGDFELYKKNGSPKLPYGSVFYTSNDDGTYTYDITAPKTYEGKQFMYWAIYSDSRCRKEDLVINAYNSEGHFSYVAYDNCWIVPVYGESSTPVASVKDVYTSTQFMEVTRNQWTANNSDSFTGFDVDTMTTLNDFKKEYGEDKLYADFVLNFFYNGKQLSVFDPNSEKVKAGVLIQRLELDENKNGPGYITDLNHYANKYSTEELAAAEKDAIQKITTGNSVITSVKQQINNSRLDNKNRLQYYTRFNNVKDNSDYVFRLYTYIQYTDADGQPVVELSNPVYFTFYDIANK